MGEGRGPKRMKHLNWASRGDGIREVIGRRKTSFQGADTALVEAGERG